MNRLTAKEIIKRLKEYWDKKGYSISDFAFISSLGQDTDDIGVGMMEEVYQYGGEGQGERWESVKYFRDHDVYLKIRGFYQSYSGTDFPEEWDGVFEVRPKEKTITVYE